MFKEQLNQVNAQARTIKSPQDHQGHSLQQVPVPKTGSTAGVVQILATAATALKAAPHSIAGYSQVQHTFALYLRALACWDAQ